jgi:hypothetical protein
MMRFMLGQLAAGAPPLRRVTMVGRFLAGGFRGAANTFVTHCQTAGDVADRLCLHPDVQRALGQAFERWDGHGVPQRLRGPQIEPVMRVVHIADDAEVFCRIGGMGAALEMLRSRSDSEFDPALVEVCCAHQAEIFSDLDAVNAWSVVINGCSALDRSIDDSELTPVLEIFADYADLKSTWFLGHSRAVATLAAAARGVGMQPSDVTLVQRAALVHRIGMIGVSTGIWDKPGPLSASEWERVRTVPYLTERVLCRHPRLAEIATVAAMNHERGVGVKDRFDLQLQPPRHHRLGHPVRDRPYPKDSRPTAMRFRVSPPPAPEAENSCLRTSDSRSCTDCSSDPCRTPPASPRPHPVRPDWL